MRIVVLVKEVPDTYGDRRLNLVTGLAERDGSNVLDEIGERAIELALATRDAHPGTEVVLLAMAPETSAANLRKGLALGADRAVLVADDALRGADLGLTAQALAAALRRLEPDVVVAGNASTDGVGGVLPAMVAELLDLPHATNLDACELGPDGVRGTRADDAGTVRVAAALPVVVSVTERMPAPRLAAFSGILAAKKKPFETLALADLGVAADDPAFARSIVISVAERPARAAGEIVTGEDAAQRLADFLVSNRLV
jgi:Electron transfer flavoprotein, beta subunit